MKNLLLLILLTSATTLFSQNVFIYGPQEVGCERDSLFYFIETNLQIEQASWSLEPANAGSIVWSDTYSASLEFYSVGTYILYYVYFSQNEVDTISYPIYVYDASTLFVEGCTKFNENTGCYMVCAGSTTTIFAESATGQTGFWQVSGAESVQEFSNSIEVTWGAGGYGTVEYLSQCSSPPLCFEILPEPDAEFMSDPPAQNSIVEVCIGQEIQFENTSQNGITYTWTFGDGETSNDFHTTHTYQTAGFYTVQLQAESICDCESSAYLEIEVLPAPAPTLDCVNSVCPETRQRYQATTDNCNMHNWSITGDGTIVNGGASTDDFIEVIWHSGPEGFIHLSVSGCNTNYCSATNTFRVPIITPDGPIEGDASVCPGEVVTYSAPYFKGTEYQWTVSNVGTILSGQNSNAVTIMWNDVSAVTNGSATVDYENCFLECSGSDQFNVQITPSIFLSGDSQVCEGDQASAQATAGFSAPVPVNVTWELHDASGQVVAAENTLSSTWNYTFNIVPGDYFWVALNNSTDYCNTEVVIPIRVNEKPSDPIGIIGETEICPGTEYGYTIDAAGDYHTIWSITDGAATVQYEGESMSHVFGNTPPYQIEAIHQDIINSACSSGSVVLSIQTIANQPIVGNNEPCLESIEVYTIVPAGGATYDWEIIPAANGEIRRNNSNEVSIFWTQTGPATVRLTSCGTVIEHPVNVLSPPQFNVLGAMAVCGNQTIPITTSQPGMDHVWQSEDGTIISTQNQVDLAPGFYRVAVTDAFGCRDDQAFEIESLPFPTVNITSPDDDIHCGSIPGGIELVTNTDGDDYTFRWFQDGVEVGNGPIYIATQFAEYAVEATNQYGCSTMSATVDIGECCPIEDCISDNVCNNPGGCPFRAYDFELTSTPMGCETKFYEAQSADIIPGTGRWVISSLSDGYIANYDGDIATHTYSLPGYYRVAHGAKVDGFVYSNGLCDHQDIFIDTVRMVADFEANRTCAGENVSFEDLTTFIPGEMITVWSWDFGDPSSGPNNTSTDQNPTHLFAVGGTYDVTLMTTATSGCVSTRTIQVEISEGPQIMVDHDLVNCQDEAASFAVTNDVFDIEWNFDDPSSGNENTATSARPYHTYTSPGTYQVEVSAADIIGCRSSTIVQIDIAPNLLSGLIDVDPSNIICQGETTNLTSPTGGVTWLWSNGETTESITVGTSDQYSVFLRDQNQCTYTSSPEFIQVDPKPIIVIGGRELIGLDAYGPWEEVIRVCDGTDFELHALSASSLNYTWTHGPTTQVLSFISGTPEYPGPGTHVYSVIGTDIVTGCVSDLTEITIEIYPQPTLPTIAMTSGSGCSFDANTLTITNAEPNIIYEWSDGLVGTQIDVSESGVYFVTAITDRGCAASSNSIFVQPAASIDQIAGGCFVECDPLTVCLPDLQNVASYTIFRNGAVYSSGTNWPSDYQIDQDGSYTIEVTSSNGCVATSDPLDVILYTGTGTITVLTYQDINHNGQIDAGDILVGDIPVQIQSPSNTGSAPTENGQFDFVDYPADEYEVTIDRDLLSSQWRVIIDSLNTEIVTCDDSLVVSLLIDENCSVNGPIIQHQMCIGDVLTIAGGEMFFDTGFYDVHFFNAQGCDSVVYVDISLPDTLLIEVNVFNDVDGNGVVSSADTLFGGAIVDVIDLIGGGTTTGTSNSNGPIIFDVSSSLYDVILDVGSLPIHFDALINAFNVDASACGSITIDLLVSDTCNQLVIFNEYTLCPGDSIEVAGQWLSTAGDYQILADNQPLDCDTLYEVTIILFNEMTLSSSINSECGGSGSITLSVTGDGPFTYFWSSNLPFDSIQTNLPPGEYSVSVSDQNGCSITDTFTIDSMPSLMFLIDSVYVVEVDDTVQLSIVGDINEPGLTVEWIPAAGLSCSNCFAPLANPEETTTYQILISDANGCSYLLQTVVIVIPDSDPDGLSFIPNVFTPNDDGQNDFLQVFHQDEEAQIIRFVIYDRWGKVVHNEQNIPVANHSGWDGKTNSQRLTSQVFTYYAEIQTEDGQTQRLSGDVTLLR